MPGHDSPANPSSKKFKSCGFSLPMILNYVVE
jgi:hypothetical protein